ncbi:hypothetical protein Y045_5950 [Burkholderia pseudomallei MSHR2451]|nr:hypothetical protein Y045_5950 [Burkholderia pseudomallei MSHR2451]
MRIMFSVCHPGVRPFAFGPRRGGFEIAMQNNYSTRHTSATCPLDALRSRRTLECGVASRRAHLILSQAAIRDRSARLLAGSRIGFRRARLDGRRPAFSMNRVLITAQASVSNAT